MIGFIIWSVAKSLEFSLSDGMKNLTVKSQLGNEELTQAAVLANSSINLLENVEVGEGIVAVRYKSFFQCQSLKRAYIAGTVKTVESSVFEECTSLLEVIFSEGLETVGVQLFFSCTNLESVTIPSTLKTKFDEFGFYRCSSIKYFKVSKSSPIYSTSEDESILMYGDIALVGPGAYSTITIPDRAQSIESFFLNDRYAVSKVIFSKAGNLKRIGKCAFRATSISELILPEGLEYLDDTPILDSFLSKIFFPKSLLYVGNVFYNVPDEYIIEEGCKAIIEEDGVLYDGNRSRILLLSSSATSLTITKSIKELNYQQFRTSEFLSKLIVEEEHEVYWEFENVLYSSNKATLISCPGGVRNVTVWKGCKEIADGAFRNGFISEIHFENTDITCFKSSVFQNCYYIQHITLPKKLSVILFYSFFGCSVRTIVINSALSFVDSYLFASSSIENIDLSMCNDLTTLAINMFENCVSLSSIKLPPRLTTISTNCFKGCSKLTSISLSSTIASIDSSAFLNCKSLNTLWIDEDMDKLNTITVKCFSGCNFTLVKIPPCVHTLGQGCFSENPYLEEVIFSEESVTSIEAEVFMGCPLIKSIELPRSLTSISFGGLSQMYGLVDIKVMKSNQHFKAIDGILFDESGKKLVVFPGGLTRYKVGGEIESIGEKAFMKCIKLEELNFSTGANLRTIGSYTFSECSGMASITIPNSVSVIESFAFNKCSSLESVAFESGSLLGSLKSDTFSGCLKLKEVSFVEGSLKEVGERVFKGCSELKVFDAESVELYKESAFEDCEQLESINLQGARRIDSNCFRGCKSLRVVKLSWDLEFLGTDSFRGCDGIRWIEYCGNSIFEGDSFLGVDAPVAVLGNYTGEMLGGIVVWKILDEGCNMPTLRFTIDDILEVQTSGVLMMAAVLHESECWSYAYDREGVK